MIKRTGLGIACALGAAALLLSLRYAPASIVSPYLNLEPIVATVIAAVFMGERLLLNQYVGCGMALAALVAVDAVGSRKVETP